MQNFNYQKASYRRAPSNYNAYAPYQAQQAPAPPKKSGASYSNINKGQFEGGTIVNAWNKSRKGLITATVAPYKKSAELVTSKKGHEYMKMMCKVTYHSTGNEKLLPVLMNTKTQVIVIEEMGMVITPNGSGHTSSGKKVTGYFGTMKKR